MFVFFHIPKAAGTTIRELIMGQIQPSRPLIVNGVANMGLWNDDFLNSRDLISGHVGYSLLNRLRIKPQTVVFFRNPVDRVLSHYRYYMQLQGKPGPGNNFRAILRGRSLRDLLRDTDSSLIESAFRNAQTWFMATDWSYAARSAMSSSEVLELAKRHVTEVDCVGLVEEMAGSIQRMNDRFGWNIRAGLRLNVTGTDRDRLIDDETLDLIREHNQLDLRLYEWVRDRYFSEHRA